MLVFSRDTAVLMEGELCEGASGMPVYRAGLWHKEWFYKHVEAKLGGPACDELLPMYDYLMRHDRSLCMTMGTVIPFGNARWFRWLLGWLTPPKMSFLKGSHTSETREASARLQVFQDIAFPKEELASAVGVADSLFNIYPLMVYPAKINDYGGMVRLRGGGVAECAELRARGVRASALFLNLGIYGVPRLVREGRPCRTVHRVRELEAWVRKVGGFQHTYCDSFQTEEEFNAMFDHALLRKVRGEYGVPGDFVDVYARTRPEVPWRQWLEEEAGWKE